MVRLIRLEGLKAVPVFVFQLTTCCVTLQIGMTGIKAKSIMGPMMKMTKMTVETLTLQAMKTASINDTATIILKLPPVLRTTKEQLIAQV